MEFGAEMDGFQTVKLENYPPRVRIGTEDRKNPKPARALRSRVE